MAESTEPRRKNFSMLDQVKELPTLPQVLVGISRVASNELSRVDDLADMILKDQALTMRLLRIANSAQYAMYSQRVTTVSKAVVLMGFESVRAMAMGAEMYRLLSALTKAGGVLERFWKDAMAVAVTSQELAELMGLDNVEEAFVAGLLHDVGKLIFAQLEPEKAKRIYSLNITGQMQLEEETRIFGVNHAEIGAELARRWGLPNEIRVSMESHHKLFTQKPATRGELLAFIVSVAITLVAPMNLDNEGKCRELAAKMARILRIPVGMVLATLKDLPENIREYSEFFDLQVDDLKIYTLWVEEENQRLTQKSGQPRDDGRRELEKQQSMMGVTREIHSMLLQNEPLEMVGKKIADTVRTVIGAGRVLTARLDVPGQRILGLWYSGDVEQDFTSRMKTALFRDGILSSLVRGGETVNVIDVRVPYFQRTLSHQDQALFTAPCFVAVPSIVGGRVEGFIYADREEDEEAFTDEDLSNLEMLAGMLGLGFRG